MLFHDVDHARWRLPSHTWRRTEIKAGGNHKLMPASLIERVQTGRVLSAEMTGRSGRICYLIKRWAPRCSPARSCCRDKLLVPPACRCRKTRNLLQSTRSLEQDEDLYSPVPVDPTIPLSILETQPKKATTSHVPPSSVEVPRGPKVDLPQWRTWFVLVIFCFARVSLAVAGFLRCVPLTLPSFSFSTQPRPPACSPLPYPPRTTWV